ANHFLLYVSIFTITISGILKKLYMGETLNFIFFKFGFKKDNFILADVYYDVHVYANYLLLALVTLHILAVATHHFIFKDNILKKIL
ncbi:MAG: cytochrome b, partial [Candidatus Pelagibacter sp. TMED263]